MKTMMLSLVFALIAPTVSHAKGGGYGVIKTGMSDVNLWDGPGRAKHDTQMFIHRQEEVYVTGPAKALPNGETWLPVKLRRMEKDGSFETPTGWVDARFFHRVGADDDDGLEAAAPGACKNCRRPPLSKLPGGKTAQSKSGFMWPVGGKIRSGFGYRYHPILHENHLHAGIDIAQNNRRPVHAAKAGRVKRSRGGCGEARKGPAQYCNGRAGNYLVIDHGGGLETNYMHLSPTCKLPREGTLVTQQTVIGCVGASGGVTGPHLHFGVKHNGKDVDPMRYLPRNM